MSNLSLTITIKEDGMMQKACYHLLDAFRDYFTPHTASLYIADNNSISFARRKQIMLGSFNNWVSHGFTDMELRKPWYKLLPGERQIDNNWTTINLPNCRPELIDSIASSSGLPWDMFLSGNLKIHAISKDKEVYVEDVFRQVITDQNAPESLTLYAPLLWIRAMSGFQPKTIPHIVINILSDFLLESSGILMGDAGPTAPLNTQILVDRIRQYATSIFTDIVDVELSTFEGQAWISEADRIWSAFRAIPDIFVE